MADILPDVEFKQMYDLFRHDGPAKQAVKIAGLPKPLRQGRVLISGCGSHPQPLPRRRASAHPQRWLRCGDIGLEAGPRIDQAVARCQVRHRHRSAVFDFVCEFLVFMAMAADRCRLHEARRRTGAANSPRRWAKRLAEIIEDNNPHVVRRGPAGECKQHFIDLFNRRGADYAEF